MQKILKSLFLAIVVALLVCLVAFSLSNIFLTYELIQVIVNIKDFIVLVFVSFEYFYNKTRATEIENTQSEDFVYKVFIV